MTHIDESTIHAWLDGALEAAQASAVEAHVGGCVECSAKVAEARGLIAGASRVLSALDDVPAVMPKQAPRFGRARREWRAAPWVTGIAAALVLAIGIKTFTNASNSLDYAAKATAEVARAAASADSTAAPAAPAATDAPDQRRADARSVARRQAAEVAGAGGAGSRNTAARTDEISRTTAGAPSTAPVGAVTAQTAPAQPSPAPVAAAPVVASTAAGEDAQKRAADVLTLPSAALIPQSTSAFAAGPRTAASWAGCYRVPLSSERRAAIQELAAKAAGGAARAAADRDPARVRMAPAEAPARIEPPAMVRLDTARSGAGATAKLATRDEGVGTWFIERDSVRVEFIVAGRVMLTYANRVTCPQQP